MSEIRMDVDLEHPPERIWRALTEEKLLSQWLELPGFAPVSEAEVTGVEGQRRLAMLWGNDDVSTRLVWELASTPDGATLTLRQSCVYGEWEDEEREEVRAAYDAVLHERLPAILDWLAFQEVDLNAPLPGSADEAPTEMIPFVAPARRGRRRLVVALCTAALVVVAMVTAVAMAGGGDEEPAAAPPPGAPAPVPTTSAPAGVAAIGTGAPSPSPSASRSASPTPSRTPTTAPPTPGRTTPPAGQPVLGADYETSQRRLLGYEGTVVVSNTGQAAAPGWTVKITLRDGARVTDADGATFEQDDRIVLFSGGSLAASASTEFTFQVTGALEAGPTACELGGKPCS